MTITIDFDIKEDVFYKEGLAEGREEGEAKSYFKIICNGMDLDLEISILMQLTGFSEEKILKIMGGVQKRDVAFLTKLIPLPKEDVREVLNDWEARQNKK